jgi:Fe-S cluster biogenesis protein NfuA
MVRDVEALEGVFAGWGETERGAVGAYRRAIEGLHREAIRRLVASLKRDPGALAAMKDALTDELVYGVLRHLGVVKPSVQEKVEEALASVRPMLAAHGGDVELLAIADGTVRLRLTGSCDGCPSSAATMRLAIEQAIREHAPEIESVEADGLAAPDADLVQVEPLPRERTNGEEVA